MLQLGPFTAGEIPFPVTITYRDEPGNIINLTGYSSRFVYRKIGGTPVERNATISNAEQGQATYNWVAADIAEGEYEAHLWVGNGVNRLASKEIRYSVHQNLGLTPAI